MQTPTDDITPKTDLKTDISQSLKYLDDTADRYESDAGCDALKAIETSNPEQIAEFRCDALANKAKAESIRYAVNQIRAVMRQH